MDIKPINILIEIKQIIYIYSKYYIPKSFILLLS